MRRNAARTTSLEIPRYRDSSPAKASSVVDDFAEGTEIKCASCYRSGCICPTLEWVQDTSFKAGMRRAAEIARRYGKHDLGLVIETLAVDGWERWNERTVGLEAVDLMELNEDFD